MTSPKCGCDCDSCHHCRGMAPPTGRTPKHVLTERRRIAALLKPLVVAGVPGDPGGVILDGSLSSEQWRSIVGDHDGR